MVAVTAGVVLRSMTPGLAVERSVALDVDLVSPTSSAAIERSSDTEAANPVGKEQIPRRFVPVRHPKGTPGRASAASGDPAIVYGLAEMVEPARFALSAGTVATRVVAASAATSEPPGRPASGGASGDGDPTIGEREVNVSARLLSSVPLVYPPAARQAEIEVDLPVEIVVDANGRVVAARGLSRVGYGLDEAALHAIREYRFSPALRGGRPVRVRMRWNVQFRLR